MRKVESNSKQTTQRKNREDVDSKTNRVVTVISSVRCRNENSQIVFFTEASYLKGQLDSTTVELSEQ